MKNIVFCNFMLLMACSVYSQKVDERILDTFKNVTVFGNMEVQLIKADKERMVINSREIDASKINSRIEKNELKVSMNKDLFSASKKVIIQLYYKNLVEINSTGGADIVSDKVFKADKMKFYAASGGNISLSIDVNIMEASVSEGSLISFDGNVNYQKVSASLNGTYDAFELISDDAVVKASTGGKIKVYASKLLDAVTRTKGYVGYKGKPEKTNFDSSSGGEIRDVE
jgi:Putative auto-transporter adhesin, head GIN domain